MGIRRSVESNRVMIAGCGRLGANLAGSLSEHGYSVVVIDKDPHSFRKLPANFSGFEVEGDATDIDLLRESGIENVQIFLAATDSDNMNSMIAQIASRIFHTEKVYARLNDTDKEHLLDGYAIQTISPSRLSIHEFEKLSAIHLGGE